MTPIERLAEGLAAAGIDADAEALGRLEGWLGLHQRWSRRINLTGPADADELIDRHLLDCAAVVPWLPPGPLVDVGSGAGLPGLVVAILEPARRMFLLDSLQRRCAFLEQAIVTLALPNVSVVQARCEQWQPPIRLAGVLARAVAPLSKLLAMTAPLLADGAPLLAMKGPGWREELVGLPANVRLTGQDSYRLPGRDHEHVLLRLAMQVDDGQVHDAGVHACGVHNEEGG
ncbi:MAG: 16S rRNA (guanine(527)-N(7))-methyltransferase RsmG [Gammaproteobacteria bacterium]|nr:16S rRNA (guanine(527)-N(7))-methyltransferase RsmG [Gammaproteobacteria bacterium]